MSDARPQPSSNRPFRSHSHMNTLSPAQSKTQVRHLAIAIWKPRFGGRSIFPTKFRTPKGEKIFVTNIVLRRLTTRRHHTLEISLAAGLQSSQCRSISSHNAGVESILLALSDSGEAPKECQHCFGCSMISCKITPTFQTDLPDTAFAIADWISAALSDAGPTWINFVQVRRYVQVAILHDVGDGNGPATRWITDIDAALVRRGSISDFTAISRSPFAFDE